MKSNVHQHETEHLATSTKEEFESALAKHFAQAQDVLGMVPNPVAYIVCVLGDNKEGGKWEVAFRSGGKQQCVVRLAKEAYEHAQQDAIDQLPPDIKELLTHLKDLAKKLDGDNDPFAGMSKPSNPLDIN